MGRRWKTIGAVAAFCLLVLCKSPAYAGGINDAEQLVIDYYNRTFTYDGKSYVATEGAKEAVYQKLASDGVELTERQARSVIRQASKNIERGIQDGYLVEAVSSDQPECEGNRPDGDRQPEGEGNHPDGDRQPDGQNEPTAGSAPETETKTDTKTDTEGSTKVDEKTNEEGNQDIDNNAGGFINLEPDAKQEEARKVDVQQFVREALQEGENYSVVQTADKTSPITAADKTSPIMAADKMSSVTVEQYLQGKLTVVSGDDILLFEGGLPLKKTGYDTRMLMPVAVIAGVFLLSAMLSGISCILRRRSAED